MFGALTAARAARAQGDADAGAAPPASTASSPATSPPPQVRGALIPEPPPPAPSGTAPSGSASGSGSSSSGSGSSAGSSGSGSFSGSSGTSLPAVDPASDAQKLARQGSERPSSDGTIGATPSDVYSEDWWGRTRPVLELHGYFRTRGEILHNFFLGRHAANGQDPQGLWPQPLDQTYSDQAGTAHTVVLCGPNDQPAQNCYDKTQASANLRFRVNPELHISDNLRILSQVDFLDNLVLGSTPDAYALQPSRTASGYSAAGTNGYAPLGAFSTTQGPPTAGVNGYRNSIDVKRVWGEYMTPVGQLRFGRMPHHWGLGMIANAGDGLDQDYQTTIDRLMFTTGIKTLDLYFGGSWDFVSSGQTSASPYDVYGGQPHNTGNLTNVNQWSLFVARRMNPDLQRLALSRNEVVVNGGLYAVYRSQLLDVAAGSNPQALDTTQTSNGLERRGYQAFIPDLWIQTLWTKFRFEAELATVYGQIERTPQNTNTATPVKVRQWGLTTQTEYRAVEDKLRLNFGFGWASGDPWAEGLNPGNNGLQSELNNGRGPISTFRFSPAYNVDLIFFRKILTRVEGAYYFRPSVEYDFLRDPNGQKFGGGAAIIWSRASEFEQTPGNKRDLGVELNLSLYYQARDGSLNDDPEKVGGFYTMLQYGVFFPLGGLSYLPGEQTSALPNWETSSAQTVRLFLGIVY